MPRVKHRGLTLLVASGQAPPSTPQQITVNRTKRWRRGRGVDLTLRSEYLARAMAQNTQSATASRNTVPGTANEKPVAPPLFTTAKREYIPDAKRVTELPQTKEMEEARALFEDGDYGAARRAAKK